MSDKYEERLESFEPDQEGVNSHKYNFAGSKMDSNDDVMQHFVKFHRLVLDM